MPLQRKLEYDSEWLGDLGAFIPACWCRLHFIFQTNKWWFNKFQVMFWLTTLAYSSKCNVDVLQALTMLSISAHLSASTLPEVSLFPLKEGFKIKRGQLQALVQRASKGFNAQCPEWHLPALANETHKKAKRRRNK